MSQEFNHYAQLAAGSAAEALMGDGAAVGADGSFFIVPQSQVVRIPSLVVNSEQVAGQARLRIRRDATDPAAGAPVLAVADVIELEVNVPLGAQNTVDLRQPLELEGGDAANPNGIQYYFTIEQAGGAGFASASALGRRT